MYEHVNENNFDLWFFNDFLQYFYIAKNFKKVLPLNPL